ncbi:NAD+ synthase [Roseomonas gilardii subsp. gilardii]|uniref:nitrilase-related carbon-nitrogen hydrolase n=1 Tax=Roseomonas gilardii TaxID=257708 RepID=UPI001FFAD2C5|nr:nitrilase-related carbon-nitrogen hydrolase [Roseomonas gilardii]UPG72122.1 NAD+ synthase [Roseomonas gilardii subsp. gilardii]
MPESASLRIAMAQTDPWMGDIGRNAARILALRAEAAAQEADLLVVPRLALLGAPPEDLARDPAALAACEAGVRHLAEATGDGGPGLLLGAPWQEGGRCHDAALLLDGGQVRARRARHEPGQPGLAEDVTLFATGPAPGPMVFRGLRLGVMVGADSAGPAVAETLSESGAELLLALEAEPFRPGEAERRIDRGVARVVETGLPLLSVNLAGAQDGIAFDGASFVLNADHRLALRLPALAETLRVSEWRRGDAGWEAVPQPLPERPGEPELLWEALLTGLRAHVQKNGHGEILLELDGTPAAALTALLGVEAVGAAHVRAVLLPGLGIRSGRRAAECALRLGIGTDTLPTGSATGAIHAVLGAEVRNLDISPRLRHLLLETLAEARGALLLSSATRSRTLLGCAGPGAYAPLSGLYDSEAAVLSRLSVERGWLTEALQRPTETPRPGLPPDLPPADQLDPILRTLSGEGPEGGSLETLLRDGHDRATVLRVWRLMAQAGYKRRTSPPGWGIGPAAPARRLPITNGFTAPYP